jgi:hypothetical protein
MSWVQSPEGRTRIEKIAAQIATNSPYPQAERTDILRAAYCVKLTWLPKWFTNFQNYKG